jgi:hypothetical protein
MSKWKKRLPLAGLGIICLTALAYTVSMPAQELQRPLPDSVADLAKVTRVDVSLNGTVVLSGQFGNEIDDGDEIKREAPLTGSAGNAAGEAEVELDTDDRTKQELEIDVTGLSARSTYEVRLDGELIGTIVTDARGRGSLELSRNTNQK